LCLQEEDYTQQPIQSPWQENDLKFKQP